MKTYVVALLLLMESVAFASGWPEAKDTLKASVVKADRSVRHIVKEAGHDFSKNYTDYFASFLIVRTIKCNGVFREVQCATGFFTSLYFNQKISKKPFFLNKNSMGRLFICDTFVSETLYPNKNEVNPVFAVILNNGEEQGLDTFKIEYVSRFDISALDRKRAVEIYSPLNPKMLNNFNYKNLGTKNIGGEDVRVIEFISKSKTISLKNRIICSGQLYINYNGRIRKVVVKDMDERYISYFRSFSERSLVTPYTYTVTYGETNGKIYTSGITQDLSWVRPENDSCKLYRAEWNTCRNPFKNHLETSVSMRFSNSGILSAKDWAYDYNKDGGGAYHIIHYIDTRNYDFWKRILLKEIDLNQFMVDTGSTWESLCAQTVSREEREILSLYGSEQKADRAKKRMVARTKQARELFVTLFGKDYKDAF